MQFVDWLIRCLCRRVPNDYVHVISDDEEDEESAAEVEEEPAAEGEEEPAGEEEEEEGEEEGEEESNIGEYGDIVEDLEA